MAKIKDIPKLRFSEFGTSWDIKKLKEIASFQSGYAFKSSQMSKIPVGFQLIKMSNVYKNELRLDRSPSFWRTIKGNQKEFLLKQGDTVLTLTGTVGKRDYGYSVLIEEDDKYLLNQRLVRLRAIKTKGDSKFINQLVSTGRFLYYFFSNSKGGTGNQSNVGIEDLRNVKLRIPTLPEQKKIAAFLSAVDDKIQQLTKKKALLEQYKKGVLQKIFKQEIRFRQDNGKPFPDWEEKRLGELTEKFSTRNKDLVDAKVYSVTNYDGFVLQSKHFDKQVAGSELNNYKIVRKNDFAYNPARINVGSIGHFKDEIGIISSLYVCFRTNSQLLDSFLLAILELDYTKFQINRLGEGGVRIYLWYDLFSLIKCKVPSLPEQQKIADFLQNIDTKIELIHQQIVHTQKYKLGLLQQMFV